MNARRAVTVVTVATVLTVAACRRSVEATPAPAASASTTPAPAAFDAEPYRVAASVPAVAWASVTRDGVELGATGKADATHGIEATADTPFEAASIAKTIIATCVMQLVDERRVDIDTDVSTYAGFPVRHPSSRTPITLRMLLTHTSSIVDELAAIEAASPTEPLGRFLARYIAAQAHWKREPPGTGAEYSNVGATLAAYVVERVDRKPFRDAARDRVFAPLRMDATAYHAGGVSAAARPHRTEAGRFVALPPRSRVVYPVVGLHASARDLGRFARAVLRGGELEGVRMLSPAAVAAMTRVGSDASSDSGLGWQLRTIASSRLVGHEGEDEGASTALYLDTERGTGAVVLANGDAFQGGEPARVRAIEELVAALLRRAVPESR